MSHQSHRRRSVSFREDDRRPDARAGPSEAEPGTPSYAATARPRGARNAALLHAASGVVIATRADAAFVSVLLGYPGTLPRPALRGKALLPILLGSFATRPRDHEVSLSRRMAAVLDASVVLPGVYLSDARIQFEHGGRPVVNDSIGETLRSSLKQLTHRA